jgi:hypothetical protein
VDGRRLQVEVPMAAHARELPKPPLEVRNLRFAIDGGVPRHWHGGRRSVTRFFDNLSLLFPAGERFFIDAVKAHKDLLSDERLLKEVAVFCAQEGIHAREHIRYNEWLEQHGYPAEELDGRVERILRRVSRALPQRARLSATCALEHLTALMAELLLRDPQLLEGAHPEMRSLWRWHAAEESEHRAVAYDVYAATGAPYAERVAVMLLATVIFWTLVVQHQARLMRVDGAAWSVEEWRSLVVFLFVEPGGMGRLWRRWFDYFRPGFHPWQHDTRDLLEQWKRQHAAGAG